MKTKPKLELNFGQDSLELSFSEVEELENDELSPGEAGFIHGYDEDVIEAEA